MSDIAFQWTPTVVTRAVDKVLEALLGGDKPEVVSYEANSEALWDWMGRRGNLPNRLILVWDGSGPMTSLAGRNTKNGSPHRGYVVEYEVLPLPPSHARLVGEIAYAGPQTGTLYVAASTSLSHRVSMASPGSYAISNLPTLTSYVVTAFRDSNSNGLRDPWEAASGYSNNPVILVYDISGIDITLKDDLLIDSDLDGVPDFAEVYTYGTDPHARDTDGDGADDGEEVVAGTDPTDPLSVFTIRDVVAADGKIIISWSSESNEIYTLWGTTNLINTNFWYILKSAITSSPPVNVYTTPPPAATPEFYLIGVE